MASTPITLAALATSAVSGLEVTGYRALRIDDAVEHSVVLQSSLGDLLVQLPRSASAEVHHSAKILGQSALTQGVREQLPFDAPRVLGMTRCDDTRAIVSTFLSGDHFDVEDLESDALLIESIAEVLSSVHHLPLSVVLQQGLRSRSANDARLDAQSLIERAYRSGLVPETVYARWNEQLSDLHLWDFHPVVIHGSMSDSNLLVSNDVITGVLDWSELSIGDPASDFAWLAAAPPGVLERTLDAYSDSHVSNAAAGIASRARFWHEIEIAKWLLHGIEHRDQMIIDDAIALFDRLVSHIDSSPGVDSQVSNLAAAEAASKPDSVPDSFSDTASFDMLDEDRHFSEDREFLTETVEPLGEEPIEQTETAPHVSDVADVHATIPVDFEERGAQADAQEGDDQDGEKR